MVSGRCMHKEAELGGFYQEGPGPGQAPRGTAHAAGTPPPHVPVPSHACGSRMSFGVTAGFPLHTLPPSSALTRSIACAQPDSGGQLAPWAQPSPTSSWIGLEAVPHLITHAAAPPGL